MPRANIPGSLRYTRGFRIVRALLRIWLRRDVFRSTTKESSATIQNLTRYGDERRRQVARADAARARQPRGHVTIAHSSRASWDSRRRAADCRAGRGPAGARPRRLVDRSCEFRVVGSRLRLRHRIGWYRCRGPIAICGHRPAILKLADAVSVAHHAATLRAGRAGERGLRAN